jgi:ring-1,2-phenylacetyl-CoA epoxidase subunit PaaD
VVSAPAAEAVRAVVAAVPDPELPQVTIGDLGMVRAVRVGAEGVEVDITPTYTACPATEAICADIVAALTAAGVPDARVYVTLAPAWSSDDITEVGRAKLAAAGIAPPGAAASGALELPPPCPRCGSRRTRLVSWFGATACKSAHRCLACAEPFEAFKAI